MTTDPSLMTDEEIHARRQELYPQTQQPGCPRETNLEYFALADEHRRRHPVTLESATHCMPSDDHDHYAESIARQESP